MRKGDAESSSLAVSQERQAREQAEGGFGTFRQQMSFGVHVVVMMGAFYAMGHVAGGALGSKPAFVRILLNLFQCAVCSCAWAMSPAARWAPSLPSREPKTLSSPDVLPHAS